MYGISGGENHYLTIKRNNKFKVVVDYNHFTDGYIVYGTWAIQNDTLILTYNQLKKSSKKIESIFECEKKYLIKQNKLCLEFKLDLLHKSI